MKKPMFALWAGVLRQIVAPLLVFSALSTYLGLIGIWWGVFIINWIFAIISFLYLKLVLNKIENK